MCEVVSDEMQGQIYEMRNVMSTMMKLHFEGDREELQNFFAENRDTVKHLEYFMQYKKQQEEPVHKMFKQIISSLNA